MSDVESVQAYVARQHQYTFNRKAIRLLLRTIGFHVLANVHVQGTENIPPSGPTIIMMNHTSLIDPAVCMGAVTQRFVIPMSKVENLDKPFLAPFIRWWGAYTVNRGEIDRKALINSIELLKSGQLILIAPEGTRHPEGLAEAKDGLAFVATKANAAIIPTAIVGAPPWMDKLKRLQRARVDVTFGRAFRFKTTEGERVSREALAQMSQEAMYQLALALPEGALRGVYADASKATTTYLDFL
jgi:1-acyl-sn-glycerol-3-phosphate acyltransferase